MHISRLALVLLLPAAFTGCRVGPNYARPAVNTPDAYRGLAPNLTTDAATQSLGDEKWADVFKDAVLRELIREALANNYDVKIAAQRILEQQDQLGITRVQQFPTVSGGGSYTAIGLPSGLVNGLNSSNSSSKIAQNYYSGGLSLSGAWNLDFWGLYRRQTEAARAQLLATEWGRRLTVSTIVENVATAYLHLRMLDSELRITRKTLASRRESLDLTQSLEHGGRATLADVRQAEELVHSAAAAIPDFERQIEQEENGLSVLLGRDPGPVLRNAEPMIWPVPEEVPAGIPSRLLERRPDIQKAEAELIAANANIGAARAQLFPQLAISGTGGTGTSQLRTLLNAGNMYWYASGSLTQSIFDAGRLHNNVRLTEAQKQEQVYAYRQTIQQALRSVSDSLIAVRKYRDYREEQVRVAAAAEDATRLARLRYSAGSTSYIEVLTNDTNFYSAQLTVASAREQEAVSFVQLYSALGGGWQ